MGNTGKENGNYRYLGFRGWGLGFRWTPHPVIVTIGRIGIILGSSYIPILPLLQGGGSS